jgi:xanthine dehydrogenase accessory factor
MRDFFEKVTSLRRDRQSFATATVVGRRAPVSGHLGDRAIVYADGRMEGFVGGACSREIVRKQALEVIRARRGRLVSIRPDATANEASDPEHIFVSMTCVSEGALDVYVEPNMRPRRLVIVGMTPVAQALARLAIALECDVVRIVESREQSDVEPEAAALGFAVGSLESLQDVVKEGSGEAAVVVASQGHYDEQALEAALRAGAVYVGLVASRKRGGAVKTWLQESGVPDVDTVRYPAGIDLGARTAPEVALSILAEIVQDRPDRTISEDAGRQSATDKGAAAVAQQIAVDPVCGMEVEIATAGHTADVEGSTYYFCCAQCRARFVKDPSAFAAARS